MQKISFSIIMLFVLGYQAVSAQKANSYKFNITGLENKEIPVYYVYGKETFIYDTLQFNKKGKTTWIPNQTPHKGLYYLAISKNSKLFFLVQEAKFSLKTDKDFLYQNLKIKGSTENEIYLNHFYAHFDSYKNEMEAMYAQFKQTDSKEVKEEIRKKMTARQGLFEGYQKELALKYPNSFFGREYALSSALPTRAVNDTIAWLRRNYYANNRLANNDLAFGNAYFSSLTTYIDDIVGGNDDTLAYYLCNLLSSIKDNRDMFAFTLKYYMHQLQYGGLAQKEKTFVCVVDSFYQGNLITWEDPLSQAVKKSKAEQLKKTFVGQIAPLLALKDTNGVVQDLHQLNAEFKLIIFWDPECSHCQKELPYFYEVYKNYKSKGLEVMAVYTESKKESWLAYLREHQMDWINVADIEFEHKFRSDYAIFNTPKVLLLNNQNVIMAKGFAPSELNEMLSFLNRKTE